MNWLVLRFLAGLRIRRIGSLFDGLACSFLSPRNSYKGIGNAAHWTNWTQHLLCADWGSFLPIRTSGAVETLKRFLRTQLVFWRIIRTLKVATIWLVYWSLFHRIVLRALDLRGLAWGQASIAQTLCETRDQTDSDRLSHRSCMLVGPSLAIGRLRCVIRLILFKFHRVVFLLLFCWNTDDSHATASWLLIVESFLSCAEFLARECVEQVLLLAIWDIARLMLRHLASTLALTGCLGYFFGQWLISYLLLMD